MRNRGQVILGAILLIIGVLFLLGHVFNIDVGRLICPLALIVTGVWLLLRPRLIQPGAGLEQKILGDIHRDGAWQVCDEEIWLLVGDTELDMTRAEIPLGETRLRVYGLVGDVEVLAPQSVGLSVSSTALVTEVRILGQRRGLFLSSLQMNSDNYATAERKIRLETAFLVGTIQVKQV